MKTIVGISDVFNQIHDNLGRKSSVYVNGQSIKLSKNLLRLHTLVTKHGHEFTCACCGGNGTHLEYHEQVTNGITVPVWKVMTWSNAGNCRSFLNLDHIIPQSMGGTWDYSNLRITCEYCNVVRGATPIDGVEIDPSVIILGKVYSSIAKVWGNCKKKTAKLKLLSDFIGNQLKKLKLSAKAATKSILLPMLLKGCRQVGKPIPEENLELLLNGCGA